MLLYEAGKLSGVYATAYPTKRRYSAICTSEVLTLSAHKWLVSFPSSDNMIVLNGNNTRIELRFEIESPTTMTLCVNHESLYYFCSNFEDGRQVRAN